jgi:GR25 family glycosyltransferase involved in LPS biosynthesis
MNDFLENNFKKRFVINLAHRKDRYEEFKERAMPHFDPNLIERFDAIWGKNIKLETIPEEFLRKAKNKGEVGCFLSYQTIWKLVIEDPSINDDDLILVFEDDVFFTKNNFSSKFIEAIESFKKIDHQYKFVYLGGRFRENFIPVPHKEFKYHWEKNDDNLYKRLPNSPKKSDIFDRTTHVNVFTKNMAKFLFNFSQSGGKNLPTPVDIFLVRCHLNNPKEVLFLDFFPHICYSPANYKTDIQNLL